MKDSEKRENLTIGVVGLGLIGGSMAKAYKQAGHVVYGYDASETVTKFAILSGTLDGALAREEYARCDLLFVATYPEAAARFLQENAPYFSKHGIVMDLCGTKEMVCRAGFAAAREHGFTFVGGHPMAGTHNSGFKYARADMFRGAPMVIVPPVYDDIVLLDRVKHLLAPAGFASLSVTTGAAHDRMIAFTSQLAHIVSSAYIKSPTAAEHKGFSAGSYRDMTRVAWLNPDMWTELFLENRDNLLRELDAVIAHLGEYRAAIAQNDAPTLRRLLDEGRLRKEEVDGKGANVPDPN